MTKNQIIESMKRNKGVMELLSKSKPPERVPRLLSALCDAWAEAPNMRFTQLLINAEVFPSGKGDNWNVWDEESAKKLKRFAKGLRKEKRKKEETKKELIND